ncbi:MAG: hypothetical protein ACMVO3_14280 [Thalassobaculum sp.]
MPDDIPPSDLSLPDAGAEGGGKLIENIMHFGRTLRAAGLPVGPGKVLDAVEAVRVAGIANRRDFYWTLHAVFVNRRDQREIFDQAFHVFWRNPRLLERMMQMIVPEFRGDPEEKKEKGEEMNRRLAEALKSENAAAETQDPRKRRSSSTPR